MVDGKPEVVRTPAFAVVNVDRSIGRVSVDMPPYKHVPMYRISPNAGDIHFAVMTGSQVVRPVVIIGAEEMTALEEALGQSMKLIEEFLVIDPVTSENENEAVAIATALANMRATLKGTP